MKKAILWTGLLLSPSLRADKPKEQFFFFSPPKERLLEIERKSAGLAVTHLFVAPKLGAQRVRVRIADDRVQTLMDFGELQLVAREGSPADYTLTYAPIHPNLSELTLRFNGMAETEYGEAGTVDLNGLSYEYHEGITLPLLPKKF